MHHGQAVPTNEEAEKSCHADSWWGSQNPVQKEEGWSVKMLHVRIDDEGRTSRQH